MGLILATLRLCVTILPMKNLRLTLAVILLFGILVLSACGGEPDLPEVVIVATVPPLPEPAATATPEEVSVEEVNEEVVVGENGRFLTIWADEIRTPALETVAASFMAAMGDVTVVVEAYPLYLIRQNMMTTATTPDIIVGSHTWVGELVERGLLSPVELGAKASEFTPVSVNAFTHNGVLYGMPNSTENSAFFINQDLITDCPATWSEVKAFSQQRVATNSSQYGFVRMEGNAYNFFPIQSAFGGTIFGTDGSAINVNDVGFDSAGSLAAANYYASFLAEGLQPTGVTIDTMRVWFESGKSAMTIVGPWVLDSFKTADVRYKICDIPSETAPGQVLVEVQGLMISSFSSDPQLAQTFLTDFVATQETMQAMADADFRLSAYNPVRSSADPDLLAIGAVGAKGMPIPGVPEMEFVWEPWETAVTLIGKQQATPEEAFTNAANQIRDAIAEN